LKISRACPSIHAAQADARIDRLAHDAVHAGEGGCKATWRDHGGIPIGNFYFDGAQSDLDRDLGVYMELARSYQKKRG
jgi:hypothetical protein